MLHTPDTSNPLLVPQILQAFQLISFIYNSTPDKSVISNVGHQRHFQDIRTLLQGVVLNITLLLR
jgi:hypothetical protein